MPNREYIPATKKTVYLAKQTFATIICMIPAGRLTTQEAICEMWARRKGADNCEIENGGIMPFDKRMFWTPVDVQRVDFIDDLKSYRNDDWESIIPYWRLRAYPGIAGVPIVPSNFTPDEGNLTRHTVCVW